MNKAVEPSKIVNLGKRPDSATGRGGELLNAVRSVATGRLQPALGNMFEHVDDALFDLAEKAENNAAQVHYFDGMREVRKRRPAVERHFMASITRQLGDMARPTPTQPAQPTPPAGSGELSLVADNELEESLAITSMISKNEARLSRDLFAVNQRLSVICGGHNIEDGGNPVGPALLSQTFREALQELAADMRVKLIIYKLFDRYVLSTLEDVYQQINITLIRAGVLPQLRHEVTRGSSQTVSAGQSTTDQAAASQPAIDDARTDIHDTVMQTLQALFNHRRQTSSNQAFEPGVATQGAPLPSANELLGALSVLQSQIQHSGTLPQSGSRQVGETSREVAELKSQLLRQVGALRGERTAHVANIDEDTIDLVGMLFEFILEDRNLPAQMQVLLARLQIPYLKAAILDRKMFAHRQHPARRLLDTLAQLAEEWSEESDRDHRLYDKVNSVVDKLLHDFDDDVDVFKRLLTDLQQFQEINKRRSELAEQRVAESTRGREKLEQARRRSAREIIDRIGERSLPPLIHGVLARAWANHLVLTLLRQGEDSDEFNTAVHFIDDFIASTRPATDPESRQMLRQMLPDIERELRRGLANVAFQESDTERLLAQLHGFYQQQLGEKVAEGTLSAAHEDAAMLAIPDSVQPIVESTGQSTQVAPEEATPSIDSAEWQQVQTLQPGTWLEFSHEDEPSTRAKLSWISPMSGRYLFVNRRGLKVADYEPTELAILLAQGRAIVLAANALFDRAMSAIVSRLQQPDSPTGTRTA